MPPRHMRHMVVSYDVTDDRKRARLARFLLGYCERVQKSVFEGEVAERRLEGLRRGLGRLIDQKVDSVRLYTLCARCRLATEVIGTGVYVERPEDVVL
ncbi:MAG TPA: CRISPR-associated endonuclease Cas2 [Thermodesulfobacteriota bacterium]|nr:CRISPR-associated endonuclease Cas2 [Thermodesulfobacteriota bacterium]